MNLKKTKVPKIVICFFVLLNSSVILAQWFKQSYPSSEYLTKVEFADKATGWILSRENIYKTTDGGNTWNLKDSSGGTALEVLNENIILYGSELGIRKTTDGGETWSTLDKTSFYCTEIQFINLNIGYICGGVNGNFNPLLKKTTDGGRTWNTIWTDTTGYEIRGLSFVDSANGWIVLYNAIIMKTTDGGDSWIKKDTIYYWKENWLPLRDITFATIDSGWAVGGIAGDAIVVHTTNGGLTWSPKLLGGSSLREVFFLNAKIGWFCGAINFEPFIAKTTDGGETWLTQQQIPYTGYGAESISMVNENLGWAVNTAGDVYKTVNGGVTSVYGNSNPVSRYSLTQNYPNPFNPSTTISFAIPERSIVSLKIYDLLGKEIATIVSEELMAGTYKWIWNAENFASGIYFYRLQAGNFTETKKLILLK